MRVGAESAPRNHITSIAAQPHVCLTPPPNQYPKRPLLCPLVPQDQGDGGRGGVALIKEWKELLTEVGDHQSLVASLKDSPFFAAFKEEAAVWESRLGTLVRPVALRQPPPGCVVVWVLGCWV
jgi:hypothetical protein